MKFSRLRLHGFKSFCDDTELVMEPGLTGVVGPNGCGKSNLVEALRWVMGESSYKAMRAAGMDDVIFSGSASRPSRNFAEVTLVLDNSDRSAPAALNGADVLEVTRRIEREAGSIYRVNGRETRARDVQLLFADASTGAHSPALVRQGQIGELIAAKPTQRRVLLEEAAGISGLHSRRHEAELRLRAAEGNLERVDDIIAQVEAQLDVLRRQARLATRYRALSNDIRRAEATLFHVRWVSARFAEKEAEAEQTRLVSTLAQATHADIEAQKAQMLAEQAVQPARETEAAAGAALARLELLSAQLQEDERRAVARRRELEERRRQLIADSERESSLLEEARSETEALATEMAQLEATAASVAKTLGDAREETDARRETEAIAAAAAREANDRVAELRARRMETERRQGEAEERLGRLEGQVQALDLENTALSARLDEEDSVKAARAKLDVAQAAAEAAERAALVAEAASEDARRRFDAARPALHAAEKALDRLEGEAETLRRLIGETGGRPWPPILDLLEVEPGYERALAAALGDDLQGSTKKGAPRHWTLTSGGHEDPPLPPGAEPLSRHVRGAAELNRRLMQVGMVDAADGPALSRTLHPGQMLVSAEGAIWRWDGLVAVADAPGAAAHRLAQRNRLTEIEVEIALASGIREKEKQANDRLAVALETARKVEQDRRREARTAQQSVLPARAALERAQKGMVELQARAGALNAARARLVADIAEARISLDTARSASHTDADEATLITTAAAKEQVLAQARESFEASSLHLATLLALARQREQRLAQLLDGKASWERRAKTSADQLKALAQRSTDVNSELLALDAAPESFGERRAALLGQTGKARQAHKDAEDALREVENRHRAADRAQRAAREALGSHREAVARIEERIKGLAAGRLQVERAILETLGIEARQTLAASGIKPSDPLPDEGATEARLERLKAERERLGAVNLAAERELDEMAEKRDLMARDRDELIAAIAKLRTGIQSLNREGRSRLSEAFDAVNAHFQALFTTLFGGGNAELRFVESDDPLEAGLEIIARPPGKKPTTMTLLSGGEQALTAMSLIFAVFLTNPAPICVLDEVDAPLDDANVERFCALLDSMRQRTDTRFLVITHNPITMSRVDRLFGVTMSEKGVSQLVSVDLIEAERFREAG